MGVNSNPRPAVGVHWSMIAPCGTYTAPKRSGETDAAFAAGVRAGTIASRNGKATVAPTP